MTRDELDLIEAEEAFNRAMISNDLNIIRECIAPDWVLVTPERGPVASEVVLAAIADGVLGHYTMAKQAHRIRVYGDTAFVSGRGQNTGWFRDQSIAADEWVTDIYHRIGGRWRCVLTQLTPVI
jgi:ketosteroid isomerase-like protein